MKLLLENWRRYLNERVSDVLYNKIGDYFVKLLKAQASGKEKYFYEVSEDRYFDSIPGRNSNNAWYIMKYRPKRSGREDYENYLSMTGDETIMPTYLSWAKNMNTFTVAFIPQENRPKAAADMSSDGWMNLYFHLAKMSKAEDQDREEWIMRELRHYLEVSNNRSTIRHEITHWLNAIRSNIDRPDMRAPIRVSGVGGREGAMRARTGGTDEYAQSTEELQARLSQVFESLKDLYTRGIPNWPAVKAGHISPQEAENYLISIKENDPKLFINQILKNMAGPLYVKKLGKKDKHRLIKRLFEMFEYFRDNGPRGAEFIFENWRKFLAEELVVPTDINLPNISIYDFDETIARSEGHVDAYYKGTDKLYKRMTTQAEYDKVSASGEEYDYDFSNLDYITDPTELVPVTKRLRHDVENKAMQVMILTARAGNAEGEIQMYLHSIGIPTDDLYIVGCSGCNKGEYVENLVKKNRIIEVIHFYDDSHKNIENMKTARKAICADPDSKVRFFLINHVDEHAEMKKQGDSVCVDSQAAKEADLFDYDPKNPKQGPFLGQRSMGHRVKGGRIIERKKK